MVKQTLPTAGVRGVYESRDPIRVVVVDKEPGGPVDAWNAAVNACTSPVIGLLDPASEFQPDALLRLIQPMMEAYDETVAISGGVSVPPGPGLASLYGALESLRNWMIRGAALSGRNRTMPFPGSAILVKRNAVVEAGGFTGGPLELFVRLHGLGMASNKPYRILFLPEPVSRGRTPATRSELRVEIERAQREFSRAFGRRVMLAGPFAWRVLEDMFYVQIARPWLEIAAYVLAAVGLAAGWVNFSTFLLVLLATVGMGIVLSMAAVVLREFAEPASPDERRMAALFFAAIPENLGYSQTRNLWLITAFRERVKSKPRRPAAPAAENPPAVSPASS
jgi:cellulose synthase/poly-beta-1,6-N-acetylglucosamine synthase-like glycosyltransferase